jgi:hypothetical protein
MSSAVRSLGHIRASLTHRKSRIPSNYCTLNHAYDASIIIESKFHQRLRHRRRHRARLPFLQNQGGVDGKQLKRFQTYTFAKPPPPLAPPRRRGPPPPRRAAPTAACTAAPPPAASRRPPASTPGKSSPAPRRSQPRCGHAEACGGATTCSEGIVTRVRYMCACVYLLV